VTKIMTKQLHYDDESGTTFDFEYAEAYISDEEDLYCDDEHHSNSSLVVLTSSSPIRLQQHILFNDAASLCCSDNGGHPPRRNPVTTSATSSSASSSPPAHVISVRINNPYAAMVILPEHRHLWESFFFDEREEEEKEEELYEEGSDRRLYFPQSSVVDTESDSAYFIEDPAAAYPYPHQRHYLEGDEGASMEPESMCCYFKQFGQCKMGHSCWHGHAGFAHTPCHYGMNCRLPEHRQVARTQAERRGPGHPCRAAAGGGSAAASALTPPPVVGRLTSQHAPYSSVPYTKPLEPLTAPHHHAPSFHKPPPPQLSTLVPAGFPCAFCDKSGKVMTQEIPVYEGSKVTKAVRVLCGSCLRTYQL
jgi:hypothetical protein